MKTAPSILALFLLAGCGEPTTTTEPGYGGGDPDTGDGTKVKGGRAPTPDREGETPRRGRAPSTPPDDVLEALRKMYPVRFEIEKVDHLDITGVRRTVLGEALADTAWQSQWLDKNDPVDAKDWSERHSKWLRGEGPKPERKVAPPPPPRDPVHIDGVFMIVFSYRVGGDRFEERVVVFRKQGGGTDLVYGIEAGHDWKQDARAAIH